MTVPIEKAVLAIQLIIEGSSIRTTERVTGLHRDTICRLLVLAGEKAERIMATQVRDMKPSDIECDEIWSYVGKKEGHKKAEETGNEGVGDSYCFVAIDRSTKLIINFALGWQAHSAHD